MKISKRDTGRPEAGIIKAGGFRGPEGWHVVAGLSFQSSGSQLERFCPQATMGPVWGVHFPCECTRATILKERKLS